MEHSDDIQHLRRALDLPLVAIIGGSGELGQGLSMRLAKAGVPLIIASRTEVKGQEAASEVLEVFPESHVEASDYAAATERADIVLLSVPFAHHASTVASLSRRLRPGQVVVDCVVPLAAAVGGRPTRMLGVWQGSAAEQTRELIDDEVAVVSALHTVSGAKLANLSRDPDEDVLICGDDPRSKDRVISLFGRIPGLRGIDCGPLEQSRLTESMTALLIQINIRHKTHAGLRITGLTRRTH